MKRLFQLQDQALDAFKQGLVTYVTWFFFLAMISIFIAPHVQSFNGFVKLVMGMTLGVIVWIAALRVGANYHHNAIYATGVFCDNWKANPSGNKWASFAGQKPSVWEVYNDVEPEEIYTFSVIGGPVRLNVPVYLGRTVGEMRKHLSLHSGNNLTGTTGYIGSRVVDDDYKPTTGELVEFHRRSYD